MMWPRGESEGRTVQCKGAFSFRGTSEIGATCNQRGGNKEKRNQESQGGNILPEKIKRCKTCCTNLYNMIAGIHENNFLKKVRLAS